MKNRRWSHRHSGPRIKYGAGFEPESRGVGTWIPCLLQAGRVRGKDEEGALQAIFMVRLRWAHPSLRWRCCPGIRPSSRWASRCWASHQPRRLPDRCDSPLSAGWSSDEGCRRLRRVWDRRDRPLVERMITGGDWELDLPNPIKVNHFWGPKGRRPSPLAYGSGTSRRSPTRWRPTRPAGSLCAPGRRPGIERGRVGLSATGAG